jgi:membrane associated rhomboid family serine protease
MMLFCGIFGNLLNAWAYQWDHLSVGASTAIFGALGILCAIQMVGALRTGRGWKQVAMIIGAGVALLAFLGAGARSDIGAHLFGWITGLLFGGIQAVAFNHPLGRQGQVTCGAIAVLVLLAAWIWGVVG